MKKHKLYRYNRSTCKFEVAGNGWFWLSLQLLSAGIFTFLFFSALTHLHSHFFETPYESRLRKENAEYQRLEASFSGEVEQLAKSVATLKEKEAEIHQELLQEDLIIEIPKPFTSSLHSDEALLQLADQKILQARNVLASEKEIHISAPTRDLARVPVYFPLPAEVTVLEVSGFGYRVHPFHKGRYLHDGIDLAVPKGTDVLAAGPGTVSRVNLGEVDAGYGNYVEINHGGGYVTRYAHLGEIKVKRGMKVAAGQKIALSGNSGASASPHLHFELIYNSRQINPITHFLLGISPAEAARISERSTNVNQSLD